MVILEGHTVRERAGEPSAKERCYQLFEAGLEAYRAARYEDAVTCWEEARSLNPADRVLETNIRVARAKLDKPGR